MANDQKQPAKQPTAPKPVKPDDGKPKQSKPDKFRRLAIARVPKAVRAINNVARLFNRVQYEWTDDQANKIAAALGVAIKSLINRSAGVKEDKEEFTL